MKNRNIISELLPSSSTNTSSIEEKSLDALNSYKQVNGLIERTYIAMGKKKNFNYTSQSSSNGSINTKSTSSTSEI
jgi:hypothetical protein